MILPGIRTLQKCCRAGGLVINGTREADLQAKLKVHGSAIILAHRSTPRWSFLSESRSPVTAFIKCDEFYFWYWVFITGEVSDSYRNHSWHVGKKTIQRAMGAQHPHMCSRGARSPRKAPLISPPAPPPALPLSPWTSSTLHLSSQRERAQGNKKRGEEGLGAPALPAVPSLGTHSCANLQEAADKNHLGEEITLLPAMWQVRPMQRKEPSKFLPWPYRLAVQCPKAVAKGISERSDHISDHKR